MNKKQLFLWHDSQRSHWYGKARAAMRKAGLPAVSPSFCIEHGPIRVKRWVRIGQRHARLLNHQRQEVW